MPITQSFLNSIASLSFKNVLDIDSYFNKNHGQDFIGWFNEHVAKLGFWGKSGNRSEISMSNDSLAHDRFNQLWSSESIGTIFNKTSVSLLQFLSLQSIINNETGGSLLPLTEKVGFKDHPGIAYAFDKIPILNKRSYNTLSGNKSCLELFNTDAYNSAFGTLPLGSTLRKTSDTVWAGEIYPLSFSTSTHPESSGYVLEADFFKFRGRGFIQTTGRTNYIGIINFVMSYSGTNITIKNIKTNWAKKSISSDVIATISTNAEWDSLFQNSGLLIPAKGIAIHNVISGNYLEKIDGTNPTTAATTIRNVGKKISGGDAYANLFLNRVTQIIDMLS